MPGELGNETDQQGVGYYERRYPAHGDWNSPNYGVMMSWGEAEPLREEVRKVLEKSLKKKDKDPDGKFK